MLRKILGRMALVTGVAVAAAVASSVIQTASARDVVRIADGDCNALKEAFDAVPGTEPALVVLSRNGHYACGGYAFLAVGVVELDGAGATLDLTGISQADGEASAPVLLVVQGARASVRNVHFAPLAGGDRIPGRSCCTRTLPAIVNNGTLVIDASAIDGGAFENGAGQETAGFLVNTGEMTLRNVTLYANHYAGSAPALITSAGGRIELSHTTIVTSADAHSQALLGTRSGGSVVVANSIVVNDGLPAAPVCAAGAAIVSHGGNVFGDSSCAGIDAESDVIATDAGMSDYGLHGGIVPTLALRCGSVAMWAGRAASCEATDARGNARGIETCDAGAFEQKPIFTGCMRLPIGGRLAPSSPSS